MIYQIKPVIGNKVKKNVIDYIKKTTGLPNIKLQKNLKKNFLNLQTQKNVFAFLTAQLQWLQF